MSATPGPKPVAEPEDPATFADYARVLADADAEAAPGLQVIGAKDAAVMRAAQAALDAPGLPGRDEFLALCMMARLLSMSGAVPKALQGKPHDTLVVLLTGRDLKLPITAAIRKVYVVDGAPTLASQLKLSLIRREGLGRIQPHPENSDLWAAAIPLGPDGEPMGPALTFTWEDAIVADLVDPTCLPDHHNIRDIRRHRRDGSSYVVKDTCECKDNWRHYPRRMLWQRASGYAADDYFPEVSMGLYDPEELGAFTDEHGNPLDPATVELPEGFAPAGRAGGPRASIEDPADPADLELLGDRIAALPAEQRAKLADQWRGNDRLATHRLEALPKGLTRLVQSLVAGLEREASSTGWDAGAALQEVRAARRPAPPPAAPEEAAGEAPPPDPPAEDPEGQASADTHAAEVVAEATNGEVVEEVTERVRAMPMGEVEQRLRDGRLPASGKATDKRLRLVAHLVEEATGRQVVKTITE